MQIHNLSNLELRRELAKASGWINLRTDSYGNLVGSPRSGLNFAPELIPDWCENADHARTLEMGMKEDGLIAEYIRHLALITAADVDTVVGLFPLVHATPRQRAQAALATVRSTACGNVSDGTCRS